MDDVNLQNHCPLDSDGPASGTLDKTAAGVDDLPQRALPQPQAGLGQLNRLPAEILAQILLQLNIRSLLAFKQVNHKAVSFVDSLPRYSVIRKQCPDILRAAIGVRSDAFSCNALYETLTAHRYATCSRSGTYLYLITCKRVCWFCLIGNTDYLPVSLTKAANLTGLPRKIVKQQLPHIYSIPGRYGALGRKSSSRRLLFDRQAVLKATPMDRRAVEALASLRSHRHECHMPIITAPYLSSSNHQLDWGLYCYSCSITTEPAPTHFREHLRPKASWTTLVSTTRERRCKWSLTETERIPGKSWNEFYRLGLQHHRAFA